MKVLSSPQFIDPTPGPRTFPFGMPINIVADINGDGFVDMVTFPSNFQFVPRFKPIAWKNNGDGTFSYATDSLIENADAATREHGLEFVMDVVPGDFNSDGIMDYMLIDTGYEPPGGPNYFAGNKPHLLLGTGRGLRWVEDAFDDRAVSFNHIGDAADFDGDGDLDLLVASYWNTRIYTNDGTGKFTPGIGLLPGMFEDRNSEFDASGAEFVRVGNRYNIVVGDYVDFGNGAQKPMVLSLGTDGKYKIDYYLERPIMPYASRYGAVDMYSNDINGDGREDLVIGWNTLDNDSPHEQAFSAYSNKILTVWLQDSSGKLVHAPTRDIFMLGDPLYKGNLVWRDVNGDGHIDFYQQTHGHHLTEIEQLLYINDGTGHFHNDRLSFNLGNQDLWLQPEFVDANNDGLLDVVSNRAIFREDSQGNYSTIGESITTWLFQPGDLARIACEFPCLETEKAAGMIGAVFGEEGFDQPRYLRIGTELLKTGGMDYDDLGALALQVVGAHSPRQIVSTLWENVVGRPATTQEMQPYLRMLETGTTPGDLAVLAATNDFNLYNVSMTLVGVNWDDWGLI